MERSQKSCRDHQGHHCGFNRPDGFHPKTWVWDSLAKQWDRATEGLGVWTPPVRFTENLCDNFSGYWRQNCCHSRPVGYSSEQKYDSTAPRWDGIYLARFWTCSEPITLSFFPVSSFWNGNAYLCHHCNLEVHWLIWFHRFTGRE